MSQNDGSFQSVLFKRLLCFFPTNTHTVIRAFSGSFLALFGSVVFSAVLFSKNKVFDLLQNGSLSLRQAKSKQLVECCRPTVGLNKPTDV